MGGGTRVLSPVLAPALGGDNHSQGDELEWDLDAIADADVAAALEGLPEEADATVFRCRNVIDLDPDGKDVYCDGQVDPSEQICHFCMHH